MQTIIKYTVILLAINLLVACATNAKKKPSEVTPNTSASVADCLFPNSETLAPDWVCDVPVSNIGLQAVGIAEKSKAGISFMRDQAKLDALANIVDQYNVDVSKMVKTYLGHTGIGDNESINKAASSVKKSISGRTLHGVQIYKSLIGPNGRLYMLVGVSTKKYNALVKKTIKTSMKNDEALWQEFKAQKSHDELAAEIVKMKLESVTR